jgi:rifampicin phosphotransferase
MPPFAFESQLPGPSTWPLRTDRRPGDGLGPLVGIGVSSGVGRGKARIITDPADPRGLEPGEVLVAPLTDPAWTPLFLAAAAVVVDVGALQSHAAIVARELGIPAVVSVDGASRRLVDGDEIEVDGDRGIVTVLG